MLTSFFDPNCAQKTFIRTMVNRSRKATTNNNPVAEAAQKIAAAWKANKASKSPAFQKRTTRSSAKEVPAATRGCRLGDSSNDSPRAHATQVGPSKMQSKVNQRVSGDEAGSEGDASDGLTAGKRLRNGYVKTALRAGKAGIQRQVLRFNRAASDEEDAQVATKSAGRGTGASHGHGRDRAASSDQGDRSDDNCSGDRLQDLERWLRIAEGQRHD